MNQVATDKWGSLRKHPISAQNFYDPLIWTLGEAANFEPAKPVDFKSLYVPVCEKMGITLEQYGKPDASEMYWVERWIQEAFKAFLRFKWATRMGRGQWALTHEGVAKAFRIKSESPASATTQETLVEKSAEVKENPEQNGGVYAENVYHQDPYIRALAVQEVSCFGQYSSTSTTCTSCQIQFNCINALAAAMSRLNALLKIEALEALKPKVTPERIPDEPQQAGKASNKSTATLKGPGRRIDVASDTFCKACGGAMAIGEDAIWVRSGETDPSPGIYHPACYMGLV